MSEMVHSTRGALIKMGSYRCPLEFEQRCELICLLQKVWTRTDVDWLQSMAGKYADSAVIRIAVAYRDEIPVATATTVYSKASPEICVIMDVVVDVSSRGEGIGAKITDWIVRQSFAAGCKVAYLGSVANPSVYEKIGFSRYAGIVMRRGSDQYSPVEEKLYAKGQPVKIRQSHWGDLAPIVCLHSQPLRTKMLNYRKGIYSSSLGDPHRAVGGFTSIRYESEDLDGMMVVLQGERVSRVLGYGVLFPGAGPAKNKIGEVDIAFHDNYAEEAVSLISFIKKQAFKKSIEWLEAFVLEEDHLKRRCFESCGFTVANHLGYAVWSKGVGYGVVRMVKVKGNEL